jgi:hypothetical protein
MSASLPTATEDDFEGATAGSGAAGEDPDKKSSDEEKGSEDGVPNGSASDVESEAGAPPELVDEEATTAEAKDQGDDDHMKVSSKETDANVVDGTPAGDAGGAVNNRCPSKHPSIESQEMASNKRAKIQEEGETKCFADGGIGQTEFIANEAELKNNIAKFMSDGDVASAAAAMDELAFINGVNIPSRQIGVKYSNRLCADAPWKKQRKTDREMGEQLIDAPPYDCALGRSSP